MRGIAPLTLAAVLALGSIPGCAATETTQFHVYDVNEMYGGSMDDEDTRVFVAMIRDAVGQDLWFDTSSTMHVIDGVLTVRTTSAGHEELQRFFGQFRAIHEIR